MTTRRSFDVDRRSAGRHHQHPIIRSTHLIIEVHADNRVAAKALGLLLHLGNGEVARTMEFGLVCGGPPAVDVANAGEDVLETLAPRIASSVTMPMYLVMCLPSTVGVMVISIFVS
jgi:hypothetical protein